MNLPSSNTPGPHDPEPPQGNPGAELPYGARVNAWANEDEEDLRRPRDTGYGTTMALAGEGGEVQYTLTIGRQRDKWAECLACIDGVKLHGRLPTEELFAPQRQVQYKQWLVDAGIDPGSTCFDEDGNEVHLNHLNMLGGMEEVFQAELQASKVRRFERRYGLGGEEEEPELEVFSTASLEEEQSLEPIVDGFLWHGLLHGVFAPQKSGKTHLGVDLCLSVGHSGAFLNHFPVRRRLRTLMISPESSGGLLAEIVGKVARGKGLDPARVDNCLWSTSAIRIDRPKSLDALGALIRAEGVGLLVLDSIYRMMSGGDVSNLFYVGRVLADLQAVCAAEGCTCVFSHHTVKRRDFRPGRLADAAWAGFGESVRSWCFLSDRSAPQPGRLRPMCLSYGSTITPGDVLKLDIDCATWDVRVQPNPPAAETGASSEADAGNDELVDHHANRLLDVVRKHPRGETKSKLRTEASLTAAAFDAAAERLLATGKIEPCNIRKNNRAHAAYRAVDAPGKKSETNRKKTSAD